MSRRNAVEASETRETRSLGTLFHTAEALGRVRVNSDPFEAAASHIVTICFTRQSGTFVQAKGKDKSIYEAFKQAISEAEHLKNG